MSKLTVNASGTLVIVKREPSSIYGNPRYLAMVNNIVFYTKPNSTHGYSITNYEGKNVNVILSNYRGKLSLDKITIA